MNHNKGWGWFKMYPRNILSNAALKDCSAEAECLALRMMCRMALSPRKGYLLKSSGEPIVSATEFAKYADRVFSNIEAAWNEVIKNRVFETEEGTGALYEPQMVADMEASELKRQVGSLGGNPSLVKQQDNGQVKKVVRNVGKPLSVSILSLSDLDSLKLIPPQFKRGDVRDALKDWIEYRASDKKPWTDRAAKMQFKLMSDWSSQRVIEAINTSIAHQWQGIFEIKQYGGKSYKPAPPPHTPIRPEDCKAIRVECDAIVPEPEPVAAPVVVKLKPVPKESSTPEAIEAAKQIWLAKQAKWNKEHGYKSPEAGAK